MRASIAGKAVQASIDAKEADGLASTATRNLISSLRDVRGKLSDVDRRVSILPSGTTFRQVTNLPHILTEMEVKLEQVIEFFRIIGAFCSSRMW